MPKLRSTPSTPAQTRLQVAHETGESPVTEHLLSLVEDEEADTDAIGLVLGLSPDTTVLVRKTLDAAAEADESKTQPSFGWR